MTIQIPGIILENKIAEGACAEVYRGVDEMSGCEVAVKILHPRNLGNRNEAKRLLREGALASKVRFHDCIAQTFRYGKVGATPYVVQEFVCGTLLRDVLRERKTLEDREIVELAAAMARALRHLHEAGIVHKDLKPDNIVMTEDGKGYKLIDFGNAETLTSIRYSVFRKLEGSPAYMSPEFIETRRPDAQTDLYALACTLYECATGHPPYVGRSLEEILKQQVDPHKSPRPPKDVNPNISPYTNVLICRGLVKNQEKRYHVADEMLIEISKNRRYRINLSNPVIKLTQAAEAQEDSSANAPNN